MTTPRSNPAGPSGKAAEPGAFPAGARGAESSAPCPGPSGLRPASPAGTVDAGFGVYVHWPFCRSKCPYCDFNSHVRAAIDQARWRRALVAELEHFAGRTPGRTVTSVFFGGGTPSLMAPETAAAVVEAVGRLWPLAPDVEVTLEANPTSVERGRLAAYRAAGIGRVSLGVQALDDAALAFLGREHSAAEALAAVEAAAAIFPRHSFDLIYARPGQTVAVWRDELARALAFARGHVSLYQLTIEPGTAFHSLERLGALSMPDEDTGAALWEATQETMEAAGLPAYEISNHAAPGAECRHNLTYWRGGEWIGVGPGAHGRLAEPPGRRALHQIRAPEAWLAAVERDGHGTREEAAVGPEETAREFLLMGFRLAEGVDLARIEAATGLGEARLIDARALAMLTEHGFVLRAGSRIAATAAGRQRLDALLARLVAA